MRAQVAVWPDRFVRGWFRGTGPLLDSDGLPVETFPLISLEEALESVYVTDAHFTPARLRGEGLTHQPRLRLEVLPLCEAEGCAPVFDVLVIDVDAPKPVKARGEGPLWGVSQVQLVQASALGSGLGWYATRGGCRLLWLVDQLPVAVYLSTLAAVRAALADLGVTADPLVDWSRSYRLPRVRRLFDDGSTADERWPMDLSGLGPLTLEVSASTSSPFAGIGEVSQRFTLPEVIPESGGLGRNRTLFAFACKLRDSGADEEEILAAISALNQARCVPPMSLAELEKIARSASKYEPTERAVAKSERAARDTVIVRAGELPELVAASVSLLVSSGAEIYQRAGELVAVDRDPDAKRGLEASPGTPAIRTVGDHRLRVLLASIGDWRQMRRATDSERVERLAELTAAGVDYATAAAESKFLDVPCDPPLPVISAVQQAGAWPGVRPLVGVTETPTLRPDGTCLDAPGYDDRTGIVFSPPDGLLFPTSAAAPDRADALDALASLKRILAEFPFGSQAHRSVALAALVTSVCRFGIEGPTPLFLFDSPSPGSGKTLIADMVSILTTGRSVATLSLRDDAEVEKRITAHLVAGKRVLLLDNVGGWLGGPALDAALTSDVWSGRILGESRLVEVPNRCVWMATGVNIAIKGDLARRSLRCLIDAEQERPEERSFTIADLPAYVRQHRGRLVAACLTIARAYALAGRPSLGLTTFGSFGAWSRVVRAPLVWLGEADPCSTLEELRETADRDLDAWASVLSAWELLHQDRRLTVPELVDGLGHVLGGQGDAQAAKQALREALTELAGGATGDLNPRRVGQVLAKYRGRIVGGRRLAQTERGKHGRRWYVDRVAHGILDSQFETGV